MKEKELKDGTEQFYQGLKRRIKNEGHRSVFYSEIEKLRLEKWKAALRDSF